MASVLERGRAAPAASRAPSRPVRRAGWSGAQRVGVALVALRAADWLSGRLNRGTVPPTSAGAFWGDLAGELGRGAVAGLVGTLAITVVAAADKAIRRRLKQGPAEQAAPSGVFPALIEPWLFSADAVGKVLGGLTPADDAARRRLALAAHVLYGSAWGASLGVLAFAGLRGPVAIGALFGGVLGTEMVLMPRAGFFPPVGQWGREAVIASGYQHAVYAVAAGLTFDALQPRSPVAWPSE